MAGKVVDPSGEEWRDNPCHGMVMVCQKVNEGGTDFTPAPALHVVPTDWITGPFIVYFNYFSPAVLCHFAHAHTAPDSLPVDTPSLFGSLFTLNFIKTFHGFDNVFFHLCGN